MTPHPLTLDPLTLLAELTSLPGPPGQERPVREALAAHVEALGLTHQTDAKGNLLVSLGDPQNPAIVVTAHLDEIAMIVREVLPNGLMRVGPLGGLFPWKIGEGPVDVLAKSGPIPGALSLGSIHTADPGSTVRRAEHGAIGWSDAYVRTGLSYEDLLQAGVTPGVRVVLGASRRALLPLGPLVAGHFLDDRADLVSWLIALQHLTAAQKTSHPVNALFAATAAEEVGGEGALFLLQKFRPDLCLALELAPLVPDAPIELSIDPVLWVTDSYATMAAEDIDWVARAAKRAQVGLQYQALSRGGSDASCAASHGLCGRPITLGLPMDNSHGYEVMHPGAMAELAKLTVEIVRSATHG